MFNIESHDYALVSVVVRYCIFSSQVCDVFCHMVFQAILLSSHKQIRLIKYFFCSCYILTALLGVTGAGLGSSLGAVPGGQPSAPNLNPPSQIDPSSIERAYAALGLTYQGNQIQVQTAQPNIPNQGLQGQTGMRPLNPMGESD